jgi:hypothetical protein
MDKRLQQSPSDMGSDYAQTQFQIRQAIMKLAGATIVEVMAVDTIKQTVDIHPLVSHVDNFGQVQNHGTVHGCPYFRLQAGNSAMILDPVKGDIGVAIFAQRDISSVIATKKTSSPASNRIWDMSDGLYFGGILNPTPTQFVKMDAAGINITSAVKVIVNAPAIEEGNGGALKALVNDTFIALYNSHTHPVSGALAAATAMQSTANTTTVLKAQ